MTLLLRILFGIGFLYAIAAQKLNQKIIGLNIMDTSIFLFLASKGYIFGRVAPIVQEGGHQCRGLY